MAQSGSGSQSGFPTPQPAGQGYGQGSQSASSSYESASSADASGTREHTPDYGPTPPGRPFDPPKRPALPPPIPTVASSPDAMIAQANQQHEALTGAMQSVLDTLSTTIGQTAAQSKDALSSVTNALRSQLKTAGASQVAAINDAIGSIGNAVVNNATMSQATLDGIVSALASAAPSPVSLAPGQVLVMPGQAPPPGYVMVTTVPVPADASNPNGPTVIASVYVPGPSPSPSPSSSSSSLSVAPPPSTAATFVPPNIPPTPLADLPSNGGVGLTCAEILGQYKQATGNDISGSINEAQWQEAQEWFFKSGWEGLTGCIPKPTPPPSPMPPPGSGSGSGSGSESGSNYTVAPCGAGLIPNTNPGWQTTPAYAGQMAGYPSKVFIDKADAIAYASSVPSQYGQSLVVQLCNQPPVPPPPPIAPPVPPVPPSPQPSAPAPAPPPAPPQQSCNIPSLSLKSMGVIPQIGSAAWCQQIDTTIAQLNDMGNQIITSFQNGQSYLSALYPDGNSPTQSLIALMPFGIGAAINSLIKWGGCLWAQFSACFQTAIVASTSLLQSTTCGQYPSVVGLILLRGVLQSLRNLRVGSDAGIWATVDLTLQWDQADAMVEYCIKYICPYIIPSAGEAMQLYRGGWIDQGTYECWLRMAGHDPEIFAPVLEHGRPRPGIGQRQQMLWRLRQSADAKAPGYSIQQYQHDLKVDGYSPQWQTYLGEIAYNRFSIREIRQLLDSGVATSADALEAILDMGFTDKDAQTLVDMEMQLTLRRREAEIVGLTPMRISQIYIRGYFTEADVSKYMLALGYTQAHADRLILAAKDEYASAQQQTYGRKAESSATSALESAYKAGMVDDDSATSALVALGAKQTDASSIVGSWALDLRVKSTQAVIGYAGRSVKSGYFSVDQAAGVLANVGLKQSAIDTISGQWKLEREIDRKTEDTQQILGLVAEGLMTANDAMVRLDNMGWDFNDAELFLAEAGKKLQSSLQKMEAAKNAQAAKAASAAEKASKEAQKVITMAAANLRKITPVGTLNAWLRKGLISEYAYRNRMVAMQYPVEIAETMIQAACQAKGANCVAEQGPDDHAITDSAAAGGAG